MTLVLVARLVLAGVFAVAALAKLADRSGTRKAIVALGSPERLAGSLAITLPMAELAVAVLLLPASTAAVGALAALALLALFTVALTWNLMRGRRPDCHCFGQLHSAPASWWTLGRNGVLLAIATLALAGSLVSEPTSAVAWLGALTGAELLAFAVVTASAVVLAIGGAAFVSLMRSYGRVLTRLERVEAVLADAGLAPASDADFPELGLAPGTPIPSFDATTIRGEDVSSATLSASGVPTLLVFSSPHCGPCATLMPLVTEWQREHAGALSVVVASSGAAEEAREEAARYGLERVVHDADDRLYDLFQANGTPSAVLLAPDGTVGSWLASGREWIEELVHQLAATPEAGGGLPIGSDAPALELQSLSGEPVTLDSLRGRDTVLLFWNPECGFCRSMHDDLIAWEAKANGVTPRLVVVSSGDESRTRAEGFRSLVLLDEEFAAGAAFDANGTPMAVLVDADGRVRSHVVAGAEEVLALADSRV